MKGWQITKPDTLEEVLRTDNLQSVASSKVKIVKALLTDTETLAYSGGDGYILPVIPGRSAVGIVAETGGDGCGVEKGNRVYLSPVMSCGECYNCKNSNKAGCTDLKTAGENVDGYMRDFAVLNCQDLFVLPESVSDDNALFIEHIALAINITDKLNISKGDHIAVIGGGTLGNILCQLIIYYQGVPILIDKDEANLETAQKSGIYYTAKNDSQLIKNVSAITGGRMSEKSVYITDSSCSTKLPDALTAFGGSIAFAGFNANNIRMDVSPVMKRKLRIIGVTDGYGHTEAAINILVNKALNFSAFKFGSAAFKDLPAVLARRAQALAKGEKEPEAIVKIL